MAPRRVADHLLHPLVVALRYVCPDALDILAVAGAQQSRKVAAGVVVDILAPDDEVLLILTCELYQSIADLLEPAECIFSWRSVRCALRVFF